MEPPKHPKGKIITANALITAATELGSGPFLFAFFLKLLPLGSLGGGSHPVAEASSFTYTANWRLVQGASY